MVVIGVSTGGPAALGAILPELPAGFPLPVLVVQHMPPLFTRLLAERLHSTCQLPVAEASQGDRWKPGKILIAPGDFHLKVAADGGAVRVCLDQSPPQNSCRPPVDALFASIGEVYGGAAIAVILTGMGQDGLRGAEILKARGASVLAQDEASSVVWGMPGAVVNAGLADRVLPLDQVVPRDPAPWRRSELDGRMPDAETSTPRQSREILPENYRFLQAACLFPSGHRAGGGQALPVRKPPGAHRQAARASARSTICARCCRPPAEPEIGRQVVEAMTTNETYFFRDPAHYEAIRHGPVAAAEGGAAASRRSCGSGRRRHPPGRKPIAWRCCCWRRDSANWNIQILGTDFSSQVVERARSASSSRLK